MQNMRILLCRIRISDICTGSSYNFSHQVCTKFASQRRTARVLFGGPILEP